MLSDPRKVKCLVMYTECRRVRIHEMYIRIICDMYTLERV